MGLIQIDRQGNLAIVTMTRPEKLNALNQEMLDELERAIIALKVDSEVRVLIITGEGEKAFVAGADIGRFPTLTPHEAYQLSRRGQEIFQQIEDFGKPVIAAVNGFALGGGCELSLACHLRYAADTAKFGQPEVGLGVIAGYGGTQRLPRLVGQGRALDLLLSGRLIDAETALSWGLVNGVFPLQNLMAEVGEIAQTISSKGPKALEHSLAAVLNGAGKSLTEGLAEEAEHFKQVFDTADRVEGAKAFLEKRKPDFRGE